MYKKMLGWEVFNFMSFDHAKLEFDETGIINIKGYNHSGKSALEVALRVMFTDYHPQKQVRYIKTGADYFRIVAYFEDGIHVLRDKYKNGNSLYEMYKGDELVFSTKVNGVLTRVNGVPEPLVQFFGLVQYEDICFNIRSCFEKGIGTETSGSENYKALSTVLMSAEIASAGISLNRDKNKCGGEISAVEGQIAVYDDLLSGKVILTDELFDCLGSMDAEIDKKGEGIVYLNELQQVWDRVGLIDEGLSMPEMERIDVSELEVLSEVMASLQQLDTKGDLVGLIENVDAEGLALLSEAVGVSDRLKSLNCDDISLDIISGSDLLLHGEDVSWYGDIVRDIDALGHDLDRLNGELMDVVSMLEKSGHVVNRCPDCGSVYLDGGVRGHEHN